MDVHFYTYAIFLVILFDLSILTASANITKSYFELKDNERTSNWLLLKKISARSETICASKCDLNTKCFYASYDTLTSECFISTDGCSSSTPEVKTGWKTLYKKNDCYSNCRRYRREWWQKYCHDAPNPKAFCDADQVLDMQPTFYGNIVCNNNLKETTFPGCGKYVTEILKTKCNGINSCSLTVNSATFGTTNCVGFEHIQLEYRCAWTEAKCRSNCYAC